MLFTVYLCRRKPSLSLLPADSLYPTPHYKKGENYDEPDFNVQLYGYDKE
jgi:hypothetical protein